MSPQIIGSQAGTPMQQQGIMTQVAPMMAGEFTSPPRRQFSHMMTPQFSVSYIRSYVIRIYVCSCVYIRTATYIRIATRSYWGEPERAPHKWCIESKSLHSDGTTYVRTYVTLIVSAMVSSYTRLLSYL